MKKSQPPEPIIGVIDTQSRDIVKDIETGISLNGKKSGSRCSLWKIEIKRMPRRG